MPGHADCLPYVFVHLGVLLYQFHISGSGSCDPEYDDITVILQKHGEVTGIMVHPGTGTHEEENKNWQEIKKKRIEERRRNRLRL